MKNRAADAAASRAREIVASLRAGDPTDVFDTFWQLDALPVDDVRAAFTDWIGPLPDLDRLDSATRLAHGWPPRPLRLRTLSVAKDADVLDLGPVAEEQLRLAGKSWDGADLAPEERLDGELEGSFAGTLERRVLASAEASADTPLFDVLLFAEDSGVVFAAGTTNVVAFIAYGKVETRDRHARVAIEAALAPPAEETTAPKTTAPKTTAPKTTAPKTTAPKTTAPKTTAPKTTAPKTTAKKTMTKKTTAKKTTAKKTTAKKTTAKKTTAKKSTAKKTTAKKTTAKKTTATKTVAKKMTKRTARAKRTTRSSRRRRAVSLWRRSISTAR